MNATRDAQRGATGRIAGRARRSSAPRDSRYRAAGGGIATNIAQRLRSSETCRRASPVHLQQAEIFTIDAFDHVARLTDSPLTASAPNRPGHGWREDRVLALRPRNRYGRRHLRDGCRRPRPDKADRRLGR